jgi:hypothetical protein
MDADPEPPGDAIDLLAYRAGVGVYVDFGQYGLELEPPAPGLATIPVRISCTAAAAPIVTKRVSPPTVTKRNPIAIPFSA